MTTFHISRNRTTSYEVSGEFDRYILDRGVSLVTDTNSLWEKPGAFGNVFEIRALLKGDYAFLSEVVGSKLIVDDTGKVRGEDGIAMDDQATVINRGDIDLTDQAIALTRKATLENTGTVHADFAVELLSGTIINRAGGTIVGDDIAITTANAADGVVKTINDGAIRSPVIAYDGGDYRDYLINRGSVIGDVALGGGDDVFDNLHGKFRGSLAGGEGDDILVTASAKLFMTEEFGEGYDLVKSSVSYTLNDNVDYLSLIGNRNIKGTGNDLLNQINGNAGNNVLKGLGGNDWLDGGKGTDRLTGGLGDQDTFIFGTGYGHDTVTDFEDDLDRINLQDFEAVKSYADLLANHTTDTARGLLIHAGSDRLLIIGMTEAQLSSIEVPFS